ncbi:MAG TPA: hypothetical protein VK116_03690, partial [Planctomycetota bacterium]|nr:hypothetical protein [Planctomycetota bacterium]
MRALVWMLGLASFLACTTTASILIPIPSAPEAIAGSDPALADDADAASELEVAFRRLDENVGSIYSGLENALAGLELRTLEEHLRTSEMVSGANRIIVLDDIRLELERLVRESAGLDFLILCPPTGEALATGIDKPLSGQSLRRVREIAEPLFVARSPRTGIESLPDFLRRGTGPGMGEIYVPRDYVVSSRVVWARADTPAAVLLGGIDINRLRDAFERFDQGNDGVRTQLFVLADDRTFVICHGDERGERRAANAHLLRELETQDVARSSAFESGGATGMWRALRS